MSAIESESNDDSKLPTLGYIQSLFPDLNLGESGYLNDQPLIQSGYYSKSNILNVDELNEVSVSKSLVATYEATDGEDIHYVSVYSDNSYIVYGLTGGTTGISSGSTSSDSSYTYHTNRRVYVLNYGSVYTVNYYVSYKTSSSTNRSTFTSIGTAACTAVTTNASGVSNGASAESISSQYVQKAETSSAAASAYGGGKMYYAYTYCFTLKLYVDIKSGSATVRVVEST